MPPVERGRCEIDGGVARPRVLLVTRQEIRQAEMSTDETLAPADAARGLGEAAPLDSAGASSGRSAT